MPTTPRRRQSRAIRLLLPPLMTIAGCAPAAPPAEPEPALADSLAVEEAVDPAEREPTLEDRWRAPFAVISRGRTAPRPERPVVAVAGGTSVADSAAPGAGTAPASPPSRRDTASASAGAEPGAGEGRPRTDTSAERRGEPAEAAAGAGQRTHRVQSGETWFGLTRRYGVSSAELAAANPTVEPERLRAGQVLRIPAAGDPAVAGRTHTVVAGESLWGISRRYGVSIERIREENGLRDDRIRVGQVLIIP